MRRPSGGGFLRAGSGQETGDQVLDHDADGDLRPDQMLIVVPALNEDAHIVACLASLLVPTGPTVIVADGGSTDRTRALVAALQAGHPHLHLIDNPARLQSAGINAAVAGHAAPGHRVLVRCDAHAVYPPGYAVRLAAAMTRHGTAAVVVPMDATGDSDFARAAAWVVDTPLGSGGSAHRGGRRSGLVDHGHHAAMDLDWFRRIGGYDPGFSHNEDAEFDHRLRQAGGQIWLDAAIRLDYHMRPSLQALARQYWNYGRGRARTLAKHRLRPRLRQVIPVLNLAGMAVALLLAPVWPWALLWPLAYLAGLAAVSITGACRLGQAAGLWAGPALSAMHNAWAAGFVWQMTARQGRAP